jgi:hypothetical protein
LELDVSEWARGLRRQRRMKRGRAIIKAKLTFESEAIFLLQMHGKFSGTVCEEREREIHGFLIKYVLSY